MANDNAFAFAKPVTEVQPLKIEPQGELKVDPGGPLGKALLRNKPMGAYGGGKIKFER